MQQLQELETKVPALFFLVILITVFVATGIIHNLIVQITGQISFLPSMLIVATSVFLGVIIPLKITYKGIISGYYRW